MNPWAQGASKEKSHPLGRHVAHAPGSIGAFLGELLFSKAMPSKSDSQACPPDLAELKPPS